LQEASPGDLPGLPESASRLSEYCQRCADEAERVYGKICRGIGLPAGDDSCTGAEKLRRGAWFLSGRKLFKLFPTGRDLTTDIQLRDGPGRDFGFFDL
jgi:hypothetical protein